MNQYLSKAKVLVALSLTFFIVGFCQAAESQEAVRKEFAADLAEISDMLTGTGKPEPPLVTARRSWLAKDVSPDMFVAGSADSLEENLRNKLIQENFLTSGMGVAAPAGSFKPDAVVTSEFTPTGGVEQIDADGKTISFVPANLVNKLASSLEQKIDQGIARLQELRKKYSGKGLVVTGFSVSIPVVQFTVNVDFE